MEKDVVVTGERWQAKYKPDGVLISYCVDGGFAISELTQRLSFASNGFGVTLRLKGQDMEAEWPIPKPYTERDIRKLMLAAAKGCVRAGAKEPIAWLLSVLKIPMP